MPDSPTAPESIERPWLVALVVTPTLAAVVFCAYVTFHSPLTGRPKVLDFAIDAATFVALGGLISRQVNAMRLNARHVGWRASQWMAVGGALGALRGMLRWGIWRVSMPSMPVDFGQEVVANALWPACLALWMGLALTQQERLRGRSA